MTAREKAEDYFHRICDGHRNAIQRPADPSVDRIFRNMIEKANCNGDCIINVGKGVFRPIPSDPVDEAAFHEYIAKDLHRAMMKKNQEASPGDRDRMAAERKCLVLRRRSIQRTQD